MIFMGGIKVNINSENYDDEATLTGTIGETALIPVKNEIVRNKFVERIERYSKRAIDILGGLVGTLCLIPLTIFIYIANRLQGDKGPIFYSQDRIGKNGKLFRMYKYRSMVVGADDILKEYLEQNEEARKEYKKNKKLKNDPRITKIGAFIRKTSLDEFPQFINVLKGEMSMVGPRPYLPREKEDMGSYYTCITKCKPGVTGFWQVNGRSDVDFAERLNMDLIYYNEKSFKNDLKIIIKTIKNLVKKEGAI